MKFGLLVIIMVLLTLLAAKVYPQLRDCHMYDIEDCFVDIENPNIAPTKKCCDEFRRHRDCLCFYKQHYFNLGDIIRACNIEFHDICIGLSK